MLSKTRITPPKLISYILSFTTEDVNNDVMNMVFPSQIKSNDEFNFSCLKFGESKNINDFPEKMKTIFDPFIKDFIRYGIKKTFDNDNNLSFYYSVLSLLVNNFDKLPTKDQFNYITKLRDKLIIYMSNDEIFKQQEYTNMGWIKKDLMNSLIKFKINKIIVKIVADYFNINIFVLNIMEDRIYVSSDNETYDMFRPNIFLAFNNDTFEPLIYSDSGLLDYNSGPVKKLITVDKNYVNIMNANLKDDKILQFTITLSNINKYIKDDSRKNNKIDSESTPQEIIEEKENTDVSDEIENNYGEIIPDESDANAYIKDIEENNNSKQITPATQLVFKISPKMKLEELQEVAKKLNITLEKETKKGKTVISKQKTKGELIDEINVVLKN
ncbi:hypothetical protein QKU48_gp0303 [Fadolivirus algeromassiliense]|jgi:hypothetical protein|uniref:Uncharacterized protein n=1 Tax=Fadolivirus FV1/VV64 TaxID=3070911 RepID=A0A7D3R0K5_9VIRU|nr:hypothetical protein QKU48_gp0303 [Fadolivirus algeromassiliense]QKF93761.1 hypothetical protein Fadolivirus_1_303 [Fadolivirus FV1/VV64]